MLLGSIEAGGTKFICAVGDEFYQIRDKVQIPTTTPDETLSAVVEYFKQFKLNALGIVSFGPIEIRKTSPKYGYITTTPKVGWSNVNFLGFIKKYIDVPISWTTDVNGSAFGEYIMSKVLSEKINSLVYYTIGTGIGAGAVIDGHLVGSIGHTEMGHVLLKRHPDDLGFKGICPYHHDCLEGLASGPTFKIRTGKRGEDVPLTNKVWDILAYYIAQAAIQVTLILRPNKIVFGGGVANKVFLDKVRIEFKNILNGYIEIPPLEQYITMPQVANNGSANIGNFALAKKLLLE